MASWEPVAHLPRLRAAWTKEHEVVFGLIIGSQSPH